MKLEEFRDTFACFELGEFADTVRAKLVAGDDEVAQELRQAAEEFISAHDRLVDAIEVAEVPFA